MFTEVLMVKAYYVEEISYIRVFDFDEIERSLLLTIPGVVEVPSVNCLAFPVTEFRRLFTTIPSVIPSKKLIEYVEYIKSLPSILPDSYWQSLLKDVVLRPFQLEFLNWAEHRRILNGPPKGYQKGVICSLDQGLGKTIVGLAWDQHLRRLGIVKKTLIVCKRNNKRSTWEKHITKLTNLSFVNISGDKPKRLNLFEQFHNGNIDIALVHYEAFRIHPKEVILTDHVMFDEAQKVANQESLQSKVANAVTAKAKVVTLLSGGVAQNKVETQYWHPLHLVDKHEWKSYAEWTFNYCVMKDIMVPIYFKGRVVIDHETKQPRRMKVRVIDGLKNRVELSKRMSPYLYQKSKWDVSEQLPPKIYQTIGTSLSPKQRKIYIEVRDNLLTQINGVGIPIALTKSLRLYQVCATLEYFHLGDESRKADEAVEAMLDIVPQDKKAITFTQHVLLAKAVYNRLIKEKAKVALLIGETKDNDRDAIRESFKFGDVNFLVTTIQVEGEGSDYPEATYVFRLDRDHRPELNKQAEDRAHRLVSKEPVNIIDFVTEDSIESEQLDILLRKSNSIKDISDLTKIFTMEDIQRMLSVTPKMAE